MNPTLIQTIRQLAGSQRQETFARAAEFILHHNLGLMIETGCYRGNPADGQSTLILSLLAKELCGIATTYELDLSHEAKAIALLDRHYREVSPATPTIRHHWKFVGGDSVIKLAGEGPVQFAYLDSYDHEAKNPGPCQRHQLAEVGVLLGKMTAPCAILLDDHVRETGGKTALSSAFLEERGWKRAAEGYQLLFTLL